MLKDVYPEYQDFVDFYAVNIDMGDDMESLIRFRDEQGHPWPVAQAPSTMPPQYNVPHIPTQVAIDSNGVIAFRGKSGAEPEETWRRVFQELSGA